MRGFDRGIFGSQDYQIAVYTVGNKGFISIGSVVIKNVDPEQHVSGNFALPHYHFLKIINKMKKLIK